MVLAYLRFHQGWREMTWNSRAKAYNVSLEVGRFENCREQGYVFSVRIPLFYSATGEALQRNWAVYEHRNSDDICVLVSDSFTINTPSIEEMFLGRTKWGYDKAFQWNEAMGCGEFIENAIMEFVSANYDGKDE